MIKVAYIITRENILELLEDNILIPIVRGEQEIKVAALYFVGDGVYHLLKGSRNAKNIKSIIKMEQTTVYACESSIKGRRLQNLIIDGLKYGTLRDFYNAVSGVDYIISF